MLITSGKSSHFGSRIVFGLITCVLVAAISYAEGSVPVLSPGGTIDFTEPEGGVLPLAVRAGTSEFALGIAAVMGVSESPAAAAPLSSSAFADGPLGRAKTELYQFVDFVVAPGDDDDDETVLMAQISGTVNIRGFMVVAGLGKASSQVRLDVIDITDGVPPPGLQRIVMSHVLDRRSLEGEFTPAVGADISVDLGSATVGQIGIGFGGEVAISLLKDVVREQVPFGFQALLQRGHTYRLRLMSENEAKTGIGGGLAQSSFYALFDIPLGILDPNVWLGSVNMPMLDSGPRVFNIPNRPSPSFSFPEIKTSIGSFGGANVGLALPRLFAGITNTSDMLTRMNVNNTLRQELTKFLGDFSDRIEEGIDTPGVDLRRLEVTLEQDNTEALAEVSDQIDELKEILLRHPPFTRGPKGRPFH